MENGFGYFTLLLALVLILIGLIVCYRHKPHHPQSEESETDDSLAQSSKKDSSR